MSEVVERLNRMGWKTVIGKFNELSGTRDPILFKYPVRKEATRWFFLGALFIGVGWFLLRFATRKAWHELGPSFDIFDPGPGVGWVFGIFFALFGVMVLLVGLIQLVIHRYLEIDERAKVLTTVHCTFLGKEQRSKYPILEMSRWITKEYSGDPETMPRMELILEMKDGRQINLAYSFTLAEGNIMAARMMELTGIFRSHEVHRPDR